MNSQKILILDYSTDRSETPAIKRWLPGNAQVTAHFIDTEESFPDNLIDQGFTHIIHTGSALSITKPAPFTEKAIHFIQRCQDKGVSQMGICYGHQLVCLSLIGKQAVRAAPNGLEVGWDKVKFTQAGKGILGVKESERVWQYHFDEVTKLPDGSELLATNEHTKIQAYLNRNKRLLGTQFHPEFDKEPGNAIYMNDRQLLENQGYNVDRLVEQDPSFETGKVFFKYFLESI